MSTHRFALSWQRTSADFAYKTYNRDHEWRFPGGTKFTGSSAPEYRGDASKVNPEEAFLAALSSCHMLTFLALASRAGFIVDRYDDEAECTLAKNERGALSVTHAVLRPKVTFSGPKGAPDAAELERLHHASHDGCFIAQSVKTDVTVEPGD